jgi:hypothetical protein
MITLSEQELDHFDDEVDTMELLDCVDTLDSMRGILNDRDIVAPPQIRDDLMKIHSLLFDGIKQSGGAIGDELPDLLFDVIDELETLVSDAESILDVLRKVQKALPARFFDGENELY